jgi:hypothetical protein
MIQRYSTVIQSCVSLTQWLRIGDMTCEQAHSSGRSDQSRTVDPAIRRRDFLAAQSTCIDHRSLPPTVIGSALQLKKSFGCAPYWSQFCFSSAQRESYLAYNKMETASPLEQTGNVSLVCEYDLCPADPMSPLRYCGRCGCTYCE